jgi:hypothetical protein
MESGRNGNMKIYLMENPKPSSLPENQTSLFTPAFRHTLLKELVFLDIK